MYIHMTHTNTKTYIYGTKYMHMTHTNTQMYTHRHMYICMTHTHTHITREIETETGERDQRKHNDSMENLTVINTNIWNKWT